MTFRSKKDSQEDGDAAEVEPDIGTPGPAKWALPADAAVAASKPPPSVPPRAKPPPYAPSRAEPQPAPGAGPSASSAAPSSVGDRPELLVAGAFAGAFIVAKILKRIGD